MPALSGKRQSEEHIRKRLISRKGYQMSEDTKKKLSVINTGKRYTQETKDKHRAIALILGFKPPILHGAAHPRWTGDNGSYHALHQWVRFHLRAPKECEHCGDTSQKRYDWANKSHEYKRDLSDWIRLCVKCHRAYDKPAMGMGA